MPAARLVGSTPYLRTIGQLTLATAVTATVIDFAFKRALVRHFDSSQLGPIVSNVAFASNGLSGIVQVFLVPRILAAVGTARSLRLLPGTLAVSALAGLVIPYTFVAVLLRGIDGALRYSLQRTATELLYVPISEAIRARVKTVIDVVIQRGGQALASLALLAVPAAMHTRYLDLAVALCALVWFWLAVRVRPKYLALFRSMVEEGALQVFETMPALDQSGVEALVAALSDERDEQVVFSLDVLAERDKVKLIPTLILFHPSARVVVRALEIFARYGRRDAATLSWRLLAHPDAGVRAQAVHAVSALDFDAQRLRTLATDGSDPIVASTALVELWARGLERAEEVARVNVLLSPSGDRAAQRVLLRALATTRSRRLLVAALPLAAGAPVDVKSDIARAIAADPIPEAIPVLLPMLAYWPAREPARRALVAIGEPSLQALVKAANDPQTPAFVRRHIPRSISRFATDVAVPLLLDILLHHPEGVVRYKALRGLGRLATDGAAVRLDEASLLLLIERDVVRCALALGWSERLDRLREPAGDEAQRARALLRDLVEEKGANAGERLFRVIALRYRGENWEKIFDGFRDKRWDASRELVEGVLREPLRGRVLALVDRVAARRVASPPAAHDEPVAPLLAELMGAGDDVLAAVAAYCADKMKLPLSSPKPRETPDAVSSATR
jgi:AAA family ATP:ADP antiporter